MCACVCVYMLNMYLYLCEPAYSEERLVHVQGPQRRGSAHSAAKQNEESDADGGRNRKRGRV